MKKQTASEVAYTTVKIRRDSHVKVQECAARLARGGWAAVGARREDASTVANILDEALNALLARVKS